MRLSRKLALLLAAVNVLPAVAADVAVLHNGFSIRHEQREEIGAVTRLYTTHDKSGYVDVPTTQIDRFERDSTPAAISANPQGLPELINTTSGRYHLDPDLVNSVIHAESGFNPRAVSRKGARGLMQLMPQTASQLGVTNVLNPEENVEGGTRYLRELLERYDFDLIKALAAYNAGPGRVEQYHDVPPYYETQAYVAKIIRDFNRKKLAERKAAGSIRKLPHPRQAALAQSATPTR